MSRVSWRTPCRPPNRRASWIGLDAGVSSALDGVTGWMISSTLRPWSNAGRMGDEARTEGWEHCNRLQSECNPGAIWCNCARIGGRSVAVRARSDRTAHRHIIQIIWRQSGQSSTQRSASRCHEPETGSAIRASLRRARLNPLTSSRSGGACLSVGRTIGRAKLNPLAEPGLETNPPVF